MISLWGIYHLKVSKIEYLGEVLFQGEDIIQSNLVFRKNNSISSKLTLLVPIDVSKEIFKKISNRKDYKIDTFFEHCTDVLYKSIIFVYNSTTPRSYLKQYNNFKNITVSNDIYKKNIYKITFKIFDEMQSIYIDIDKRKFFNNKIKKKEVNGE